MDITMVRFGLQDDCFRVNFSGKQFPLPLTGNYCKQLTKLIPDVPTLQSAQIYKRWGHYDKKLAHEYGLQNSWCIDPRLPACAKEHNKHLANTIWQSPSQVSDMVQGLTIKASDKIYSLFQTRHEQNVANNHWQMMLMSVLMIDKNSIKRKIINSFSSSISGIAFSVAFAIHLWLLQNDVFLASLAYENMPWSWQECIWNIWQEMPEHALSIDAKCCCYVQCDCVVCSCPVMMKHYSEMEEGKQRIKCLQQNCVQHLFSTYFEALSENGRKIFNHRYRIFTDAKFRTQCQCVVCWCNGTGEKLSQCITRVFLDSCVMRISVSNCRAVMSHMASKYNCRHAPLVWYFENIIEDMLGVIRSQHFISDQTLTHLVVQAVVQSPDLLHCMVLLLHDRCVITPAYVQSIVASVTAESVIAVCMPNVEQCTQTYQELYAQNLQNQSQQTSSHPAHSSMPICSLMPSMYLVRHGLCNDAVIRNAWLFRASLLKNGQDSDEMQA